MLGFWSSEPKESLLGKPTFFFFFEGIQCIHSCSRTELEVLESCLILKLQLGCSQISSQWLAEVTPEQPRPVCRALSSMAVNAVSGVGLTPVWRTLL